MLSLVPYRVYEKTDRDNHGGSLSWCGMTYPTAPGVRLGGTRGVWGWVCSGHLGCGRARLYSYQKKWAKKNDPKHPPYCAIEEDIRAIRIRYRAISLYLRASTYRHAPLHGSFQSPSSATHFVRHIGMFASSLHGSFSSPEKPTRTSSNAPLKFEKLNSTLRYSSPELTTHNVGRYPHHLSRMNPQRGQIRRLKKCVPNQGILPPSTPA